MKAKSGTRCYSLKNEVGVERERKPEKRKGGRGCIKHGEGSFGLQEDKTRVGVAPLRAPGQCQLLSPSVSPFLLHFLQCGGPDPKEKRGFTLPPPLLSLQTSPSALQACKRHHPSPTCSSWSACSSGGGGDLSPPCPKSPGGEGRPGRTPGASRNYL